MSLYLKCKCGAATLNPLSEEEAYRRGWRLGRGDAHICPSCMAKRERKNMRELEKRYGREAATRAKRQADALLERSRR